MDLSPEKYRQDFEIVRLTAEQLIKDLEMFSITIHFSGDPLHAYDELLQQLKPILKDLYKNHSSTFQSLLYRIDINERKFRQILSGENFIDQLAEEVLQREFQKILIRKFFSGKE
ncbi:MAG: hypothetical protein RIQ47_1970 [Bacteroidota bacterium]|jgi:hypothetical protein